MGHRQGKGARSRSKEKRKKAKRALREQRKALYESLRKAGNNKKSLHYQKRKKKYLIKENHNAGRCGNIGCMKCSTMFYPGKPLHWMKVQKETNKMKDYFFNLPKGDREVFADSQDFQQTVMEQAA